MYAENTARRLNEWKEKRNEMKEFIQGLHKNQFHLRKAKLNISTIYQKHPEK